MGRRIKVGIHKYDERHYETGKMTRKMAGRNTGMPRL
jgi:hypothetical protein